MVSRYLRPNVVTFWSKDFVPRDLPFKNSSTVATFAYTQTDTGWPGWYSVQFIGTMCTIGAFIHWLLNR